MCLLTVAIWVVLIGGALLIGHDSSKYGAIAGLTAIVLGAVLPIVASYWQPLILGWHRKKQRLRDRLLAEEKLSREDIGRDLRYALMHEVLPGGERPVRGTRQQAFLDLDGSRLRVVGEKYALESSAFRIVPSCTGRCTKCWVIWACGGDGFRLHIDDDQKPREFVIQCREGRTLKAAARSTEMLEEIVAGDAQALADQQKKNADAAPDAADEQATPAATESRE